jgi:hypothetical protein
MLDINVKVPPWPPGVPSASHPSQPSAPVTSTSLRSPGSALRHILKPPFHYTRTP